MIMSVDIVPSSQLYSLKHSTSDNATCTSNNAYKKCSSSGRMAKSSVEQHNCAVAPSMKVVHAICNAWAILNSSTLLMQGRIQEGGGGGGGGGL